MPQSLAGFVAEHLGQIVTAPGGLGGQCVDLVNLWLTARGRAMVRLNAADWAGLAGVGGVTFTANAPRNAPKPGAIVVWNRNVTHQGIGPYGHIAIALAADAMHLVTLDQDWPEGAPAAVVAHSYDGVAGWFAVL